MGQERTGTMKTRLELGAERPGLRLGFTLIELLVVMTIIGIILAFLLTAASDARRRAEEDATLALITKLEGGINDRLDGLLQTRPDPNRGAFSTWPAFTTAPDPQLPLSQCLHAGPGLRLVRLHQERAARRLLRAEHDRPLSPQLCLPTPMVTRWTPIDQHGPGQLHVADRQLGRGASCPASYGSWATSRTRWARASYGASYFAAAWTVQEPGLPTDRL